jgi:N-acetylmuramoyl-L-alanine amidase
LKSSSRERGLWGALLVLALMGTAVAHTRAHHSDAWAREHFAQAEQLRESLNGRPPVERTRHDYQRIVNAYREIYLGAPTSSKADPSVVAVAETLVEMGRRFDDEKILLKAIDEYKFLRREYPGSKYRADGLFTIAEIYKDDLNNAAAARTAFQEFIRRYPENRLTDDARQAMEEIDQQARGADSKRPGQSSKTAKNSKGATANKLNSGTVTSEPAASTPTPSGAEEAARSRSGQLPRVTGIRHWSTPDYTRVAIDLEGDAKFSSQRIATPSRIFFDLNGTKLASTLVGKTFDVDDGFLRKVRVAQFAPGRTRVVLEVDNLSQYDAFLLPNPYRLIIDIHGKHWNPKQRRDARQAEFANGATELAKADGEVDASSLDTKAAALTPAASSGSPGTEPAVIQKSRGSVIRKVVDAEDDDNSLVETAGVRHEPTNAGVSVTKKSVPSSGNSDNTRVPKKIVDNDLDSDSENLTAASSQAGSNPKHHGKTSVIASGGVAKSSDLGVREARPTASGDRSLIRALGLKIGKIVIDPGHGGHDTGTIGPNGLEEKDLVLEVGRRLGKLLQTRLGAEVVYTRKDDTFIPLETRTAIANQARADLFVSIHANSSHDPNARGVETYYLNFSSSPDALEVAARENAVSEKSIYELQDLVKKIAMKEKIEESREFAGDVQASLHSGLAMKSPAIRDRGVKKAPFIVLIGANMPSILAEISFVSNPTDEHRLATSEYRERIAESLYQGIAKYVNGLSGVKVASKMDKSAEQ